MRNTIFTIVGLLTLGLAVFAVGQSGKPSQKSLEQKKATVEKKATEIRKEIRENRREAGAIMADIKEIDDELSAAQRRLRDTNDRLSQAKSEQNAIASKLKQAENKIKSCQEEIGERLLATYLQGDPSPISILAGADSFSDIADRAYVMELMAKRDRQLITELQNARATIVEQKRAADEVVAKINTLKQRQVTEKQQLDRAMSRKRTLLAELNRNKAQLEHELDEIEKESRKIEAELARYYAAGGGNVPIYRGRLMQPIPGRVGSGFGMRKHPISGVYKMHNGVDIGGRTGDPIRAAAPGRVIFAGWRGGYGNCVIIDHGGGLSTLYAHASRLYVSQGQSVTQGQTIAAVGSTGYSTGPHLHWEVRINGQPVNPVGR